MGFGSIDSGARSATAQAGNLVYARKTLAAPAPRKKQAITAAAVL
jgi:hypothetical protein